MTYEEAINHIKKHNEAHQRREHFAVYITEALNIAEAAIEKQIPKEPKIDRTCVNDQVYFDELRCPTCHKLLMQIQREALGEYFVGSQNSYCEECGQAIDWRGRIMHKPVLRLFDPEKDW